MTQPPVIADDTMSYDKEKFGMKSQMPQHMIRAVSQFLKSHFVDSHKYCGNGDIEDDETKYATPDSHSAEKRRHLSDRQLATSPVKGWTRQDYVEMARVYVIRKLYSDIICWGSHLLCKKEKVTHIFFPYEYHCVCRECVESQGL